jgi:hypothetical protein
MRRSWDPGEFPVASGLTDAEKFSRRIQSLALSTLPPKELVAGAGAHKHPDDVMVALVPEQPSTLAVKGKGALLPDDLHVTLCYLGKEKDFTSLDRTRILSEARRVCDEVGHEFWTTADGVVKMGQDDEGNPATALLVQSDDIVELYDAMAEALNYESKYPSFIPHMTTGYNVPIEDAEAKVGQEVTFKKVIVKFGDEIHEIPLTAAIVAAPRTANTIDRVIDSLGRLWDEALHPRDAEGRFIKKDGAISGRLAVPNADRSGVEMVDANRANVVGFHTFGEDVWVLAEILDKDGNKTQGFAKADTVKSVAPIKARLDALYPIEKNEDGSLNLSSRLERRRQLDLLLAAINEEFGQDDPDGVKEFVDSLGLWAGDLDYLYEGRETIRSFDHVLTPDERDEVEDIITDARQVKELRERVHELKEQEDAWLTTELFEAGSRLAGGLNSPLDHYDKMMRAGEDIREEGIDKVEENLGRNVYGGRRQATQDAVTLVRELPNAPLSDRRIRFWFQSVRPKSEQDHLRNPPWCPPSRRRDCARYSVLQRLERGGPRRKVRDRRA